MDDNMDRPEPPASPRDGDPIHDEANAAYQVQSTNTARPHNQPVPNHDSNSYAEWKAKNRTAFEIAVHNMEQELANFTNIARISLDEHRLTMHPRDSSQSKLSQQELNDLQKATHFDKKELQQWYKGWSYLSSAFK